MAQTNTLLTLCGWSIILVTLLPSVPAWSCVSLITLGMSWTSTCGPQAWPRGHGWNPCTASLLFWQPFFIPQQSELFFQGNEQTGWWSSSPHYIMFLRQTASLLVCSEACCSYILTEPSPNLPVMITVCVLLEKWPLWWDSLECPLSKLAVSEGWKSVMFQDCCSVFNNFILKVALNKWFLTQATQLGTKALSRPWKHANKCNADQMSSTSCHIFEKCHKVKYSFFGKGKSQLEVPKEFTELWKSLRIPFSRERELEHDFLDCLHLKMKAGNPTRTHEFQHSLLPHSVDYWLWRCWSCSQGVGL